MRVMPKNDASKYEVNKLGLKFGYMYNVICIYGSPPQLNVMLKNETFITVVGCDLLDVVSTIIPYNWRFYFVNTFHGTIHMLSFEKFACNISNIGLYYDGDEHINKIVDDEYDRIYSDIDEYDFVRVTDSEYKCGDNCIFQVIKHIGGADDLYKIADEYGNMVQILPRVYIEPYFKLS